MNEEVKHLENGDFEIMKPIIKWNNGNGAILCLECAKIIKSNLTKDEWEGETDLFFCSEKCQLKYGKK